MAEYVTEASVNLAHDNLPVFYKYRYTFPDDFDIHERKTRFQLIFNYIKDHYALSDRLVGGMEEYTKGMVTTKPHIHIHFVSKHKSDTIRKGLMREFDMIGRCQCCKAEILVDEQKFWRYPLKQQSGETKRGVLFSGYSPEYIKSQIDIAYACWKQSAEIAVGKVEKKLERTSKDRLFAYLDSNLTFKSIKETCCLSYMYFAEHEESVCVRTIDGYVNQYCLLKKYISVTDFYELTH